MYEPCSPKSMNIINIWLLLKDKNHNIRGLRVVHWWERSPPTSVAWCQISESTPHVGWIRCSYLLHEAAGFPLSSLIDIFRFQIIWEQGWCSGDSTRLPPIWPRFKSRCQCHMWVEFVAGSLLCSKRFFSGYSGFPLFSKTNTSKFQFDKEWGRRRTTLWMSFLQIIICYLFIYLFIYLISLGYVRQRSTLRMCYH